MHKIPSNLVFALIGAVTFALSTIILLAINLSAGDEINQLRADNQRLNQRTEQLSRALARFDEGQDNVASVIEELEAELAQMQRNYASLGETASQVRQRLESANNQLNELEEIETSLQQLQRSNAELKERNNTLVELLEASRAASTQQQETQTHPLTELY